MSAKALTAIDAVLERTRLADEWRARADRLDDYGRRLRRDHDSPGAEDAEQAAVEYRIAADELELGLAANGHPSGGDS